MITIRPERPEDVGAIRAINEAAFGGSAEADIVDELRFACPNVLSLIALSSWFADYFILYVRYRSFGRREGMVSHVMV